MMKPNQAHPQYSRQCKRGSRFGLIFLFLPLCAGLAAAQTFSQIQFTIVTGGDDLRGDSSATATLQAANGAPLQVITLKTQNDGGWGNFSTHVVNANLNPARTAASIARIAITLTSHNGFGESDDNWNVQSVVVTLSNGGGGAIQLMSSSGDPLARLTGSAPTVMLTPPATGPAGTFNEIQFTIGTGGDDLRGDSSATATLQAANGATLQVIPLKNQNQPGWNNNTTNRVTAVLNPARAPAAIARIVITLTSHPGIGEGPDNWNVESVAVALANTGSGWTQMSNLSVSGNPYARLTQSNPSFTFPTPPAQVPGYLPSQSGFHFENSWPNGSDYTVVNLPGVGRIQQDASKGLCGGFVFADVDLWIHNPRLLPPSTTTTPAVGTPIFTYIKGRLLDSLVADGPKIIQWVGTPDNNTGLTVSGSGLSNTGLGDRMVFDEWPKIKGDIDAGRPSPLVLIGKPACNSGDVNCTITALSNSHQVLAWAYSLDGRDNLILKVYDPNQPNVNNAEIFLNIGNPDQTIPISAPSITNADANHSVFRGIFRSSYSPKDPSSIGQR